MPGDLYYIQNVGFVGNCLRWWRPAGHGYTSDLDEAWKLEKQDAERICRNRPTEDIPWSVDQVDALAVRHLDSERLKASQRGSSDAH